MLTTAGPTLSATWAKLPDGMGRAAGMTRGWVPEGRVVEGARPGRTA